MLKTSLNSWIVSTIECELGKRPAVLTAGEVDNRVIAGVREEVVKVMAQRTIYGGSNELTPWAVDGVDEVMKRPLQ